MLQLPTLTSNTHRLANKKDLNQMQFTIILLVLRKTNLKCSPIYSKDVLDSLFACCVTAAY